MTPAELRDAVAAGTPIPPGSHFPADPLVIGARGLRGAGRNATSLHYTGTAGPEGAVRIPGGTWGCKVEDFFLGGSMGGCGIRVSATGPTSGLTFRSLDLHNFDVGLHLGDLTTGGAADTITLEALSVVGCDVAVKLEQWNSLAYVLNNVAMSKCKVGLDTGQAGNIVVNAGGGSECDVVYRIRSGASHVLSGCRAETCKLLADVGHGEGSVGATLNECHTHGTANTDGIDVLAREGANVTVIGGVYQGSIGYAPGENAKGYGTVTLIGVRTFAKSLFKCPDGTRVGWSQTNCALLDAAGRVKTRLPNASGTRWPPTRYGSKK